LSSKVRKDFYKWRLKKEILTHLNQHLQSTKTTNMFQRLQRLQSKNRMNQLNWKAEQHKGYNKEMSKRYSWKEEQQESRIAEEKAKSSCSEAWSFGAKASARLLRPQ
jgi:hypothetical protein